MFLGEQLLLALYWAITMVKSQGQTIKKAVIYLGKSEATARLAFGCLSHAKWLVDLLVEPMPFDRLSKLGDRSILKLNLKVRLKALAIETFLRHGDTSP